MIRLKVLTGAALLLFAAALTVSPAEAGFAIRLEKEVLKSSITGIPPLSVRLYASRTAAGPVAAQSFSRPQLRVSSLASAAGRPMYRIRMDFTRTGAVTQGMDLWWELWLGGSRLGRREPVPKSAWALFAVDADTVDGLDAADLAPAGHDHDARYYTETELQTSGAAGVHWDNILNAPAPLAAGNVYRNELTGGALGQNFVACSAGADKVLGGGGSCPADGFFIASYPATDTGVERWTVECQDALGAVANPESVYAVCLSP